MTYNDKDFEFKPNIKEIIAKNVRKYRKAKGYTYAGTISNLY